MPLAFEQQPKETEKAFAAFSMYLSMGQGRTVRGAAKKLGKCRNVLERWSIKFRWMDRIPGRDKGADGESEEVEGGCEGQRYASAGGSKPGA